MVSKNNSIKNKLEFVKKNFFLYRLVLTIFENLNCDMILNINFSILKGAFKLFQIWIRGIKYLEKLNYWKLLLIFFLFTKIDLQKIFFNKKNFLEILRNCSNFLIKVPFSYWKIWLNYFFLIHCQYKIEIFWIHRDL